MKPIQEHEGWTRDDSIGPFCCPEGWYTKGQAVVRGGIRVSETALIRGGTIDGGTILGGTIRGGRIEGGRILGGTIEGGTILGGTIRGGTPPYARCIRWEASIVSPGKAAVGCQVHDITHWLSKAHPNIPWRSYCTLAEQKKVQACIRMLVSQMKYCDWKER